MSFSPPTRQSSPVWSPCGAYLAAASQNRFFVRDAESSALLQVRVCADKVRRLEWSSDSRLILSEVEGHGVVQVWSAHEGSFSCRIDEGLSGVARALWGPRGNQVLIVSDFNLFVTVWDLEKSAAIAWIRYPKAPPSSIAFSHSGSFLAVLTRKQCHDALVVCSVEDGYKVVSTFDVPGDMSEICWAPDDGAVAIWEEQLRGGRFFWFSLRGQQLGEIRDVRLISIVASSHSSELFAIGAFDGIVGIASCAGFRRLAEFAHDLEAAIKEVEADHPASLLREVRGGEVGPICGYARVAYSHGFSVPRDSAADCADQRQGVLQAAWSCDDRFLATRCAGASRAVWVWDIGRLCLHAVLVHRSGVRSMRWSSRARYPPHHEELAAGPPRLAIITRDDAVLVWSPTDEAAAEKCPIGSSRPLWRPGVNVLLLQGPESGVLWQPLLRPVPSARNTS